MNLYILRHAIAVERGTLGYADDSKRPLTPEGKRKMRLNALGMKTLGLSFDIILSSPYLRAIQTANIVAKTFEIPNDKLVINNSLVPGASAVKLINEINACAGKIEGLLLVGHEPDLGALASFLLTGKDNTAISLKKGGLCHLSFDHGLKAGNATLEVLFTPSVLRHVGKE